MYFALINNVSFHSLEVLHIIILYNK